MIGISLDIPEVACRGGARFPSWLPTPGGAAPTFYADFTTEGAANNYWFNNNIYGSFALWNAAIGGTFARVGNATYTQGGVVKTASTGVIRLPTDGSGTPLGIRLTGAQTELCIQNRDLTQAVWTATTATVAKDQVGADGTAAAASSILATAGNATVLQSITATSANRVTGAYVKRITGTGEIDMTQDNGVTWTPVTVTAGYTFVSIPSATLANPVLGFRIVTNGDAIAVDYVSHRSGANVVIADVIPTTTVSVGQSADDLHGAIAWYNATSSTLFADVAAVNPGTSTPPIFEIWDNGFSQNFINIQAASAGSVAVVFSGNSSQFTGSGAAYVANTRAKAALGATANSFAWVKDGGTPSTSASGAMPVTTNLNRFAFGANHSGLFMSGNIFRVGYWGVRVANAALQTLTT